MRGGIFHRPAVDVERGHGRAVFEHAVEARDITDIPIAYVCHENELGIAFEQACKTRGASVSQHEMLAVEGKQLGIVFEPAREVQRREIRREGNRTDHLVEVLVAVYLEFVGLNVIGVIRLGRRVVFRDRFVVPTIPRHLF